VTTLFLKGVLGKALEWKSPEEEERTYQRWADEERRREEERAFLKREG
jgi:hypothetical protein